MNDEQIKKEILIGIHYLKKFRNLRHENMGRHFKVSRYISEQVGRGSESTLLTPEKLSLMRALHVRKDLYFELATKYSMKTLAKRHHKGYRTLSRIAGFKVGKPPSQKRRIETPTSSPIARFLAMRLTRNPGVVPGYY